MLACPDVLSVVLAGDADELVRARGVCRVWRAVATRALRDGYEAELCAMMAACRIAVPRPAPMRLVVQYALSRDGYPGGAMCLPVSSPPRPPLSPRTLPSRCDPFPWLRVLVGPCVLMCACVAYVRS